jgi:hypothetical protein
MKKLIKIGEYVIEIEQEGNSGIVTSNLKKDTSGKITDTYKDVMIKNRYNTAIDAIESLVLAHSVAGIDVESKEYVEGIKSVLDALVNQFDI